MDRDLPLKKEISENITRLLKKHGWTQLKLSELTGISKSTLSDYKNCKTLINPGNVEKIAKAFGVLKHEVDPSFKTTLDNQINSECEDFITLLPLYGLISCGNGYFTENSIEEYIEIPTSWLDSEEHFLLRAKGDSMINSRIEDGDLLLIRKQTNFNDGDIMAVIIDDAAYLKKVYQKENSILLQSSNPKYDPIFIDKFSNCTIVGKLMKNIIEY